MAKPSIDALIDSQQWTRGTPMAERVPIKVLRRIESDLRKIVEAERAGKPTPSQMRLVEYLTDTYGLGIGRSSVQSWLAKIRMGLPLK